MRIKIEKGIPIPTVDRSKRRKQPKYPFRRMEIGDSFLVDMDVDDKELLKRRRSTIAGCANQAAKTGKHKFTIRTVEDGIRVWKIAD